MQKLFNLFYRESGTRRIQNLVSPRIVDFLSFPRDSVYHHLTMDGGMDVDVSKLYFKGFKNRIATDYVFMSDFTEGGARKVPFVLKVAIRDFHLKNKLFQYRPEAVAVVKDSSTLIVKNYNYLHESYKYMDLATTPYFRFKNLYSTLFESVSKDCGISGRHHFIFMSVPKEVPAVSFLEQFSKAKPSTGLLTVFNTVEKLFVLEVYKWLDKENSGQSVLSGITEDKLSKVNIVFFNKANKASIVNLGYMSSWIKGHNNLTGFNDTMQLEDTHIQKLFLKFLMELNTSSEIIEEEPLMEDSVQDTDPDDFDDEVDVPGEVSDAYIHGVTKPKAKETTDKKPDVSEDEDDGLNDIKDIDAILAQVDEEVKVADTVQKNKLAKKGISVDGEGVVTETKLKRVFTEEQVQAEVYGDKTYKESLKISIDAAADTGRLSAADYKKMVKLAEEFDNIEDPYGSKKKISELNSVTVADVTLNEEDNKIVTSEYMLDKTMAESSLQSFDKAYINKVMKKDMLMMVSGLQKAGVAITSYEIRNESSVMGAYDVHEVQFKPVDGMASTIRFRVPCVDEDGVMKVGGSSYSYRKQRVDTPIRKIDPITVALTSYYGKTFVAVSDKKANSSYDWLLRNISKLGMLENPVITDLGPANVYNNLLKAPYLYSFLSQNYKTFKIAGNTFIFDERDRSVISDDFAKIEKNGSIVCGFTAKLEPIVMAETEEFFIYKAGGYVSIGHIETMLGIDKTKSPVDFTELRVFAKTIPVGVVLGYYIGLDKLLTLLKAKYRVVEGRSQKDLQQDEYALKFADVSYIFSRKQKAASLILSGFLDFEKTLKQYPVEMYSDKDVYFNLFESKSLSSLYIRELNVYRQLFIDGITKTILEQMSMPVTFEGLLVKSTEMLVDYSHPDTQDLNHMRIRGYERISGIVYSQLSTAIRQYRNKNISGRSKIDMSPFAVWSAIMKDPAIKLVEDINPIQNMKESEIVTYVGEGGRGKESMNKATRAFHVSDVGVVSEASVDSGDVGINFYLSSNPNFKDMRGIIKADKNVTPASMVSTATMLAPGSSQDDGKRV
jgi:hypothetical protein